MDTLSTLIGFLIGTATGATGSYFATKYTEKRQGKESKVNFIRKLEELEKQMPAFINEVRDDYKDPVNYLKREFFVLNNENNHISSSGQFLAYYHDTHENLNDILRILESAR